MMRRTETPSSRGQALVEFALIAPIFFLLLFGLIEFGRAVYTVQMLTNAAREGARYAIVHGYASSPASGPYPARMNTQPLDLHGANVVSTVKTYAVGVAGSSPGDFVVVPRWCATPACPDTNAAGQGDGTNDQNETVKVRVTYTFRPLLSQLLPLPSFTLTGESSLVINN